MSLPSGTISAKVEARSAHTVAVTLGCPVFQHAVELDWSGCQAEASDNYFDLFPEEPKRVLVTFAAATSATDALTLLRLRSLVDTYE
jgi:beta-mannosidase